MNIFESCPARKYEEAVEHVAGVPRVDASVLLDILEKRAMLSLRAIASLHIEGHKADFERGRYAELLQIYNALRDPNER